MQYISPWSIGFNLYYWIRKNIPRGSTIFELGSGTGSVLLNIDYNIISVEHNEEFIRNLTFPEFFDHTWIYAPMKNGWYDINERMIPEYDLLLIDGPLKDGREGIFDNLHIFDYSKPIIVDDTNRETERKVAETIATQFANRPSTHYQDQHDKCFTVI